MTPKDTQDLLACETQGEFLVRLRATLPKGRRRQQDVADLISPLVGQAYSKQWVSNLENDRAPLNSAAQLAFVTVFKLKTKLSAHLQVLAGRAAGCDDSQKRAPSFGAPVERRLAS